MRRRNSTTSGTPREGRRLLRSTAILVLSLGVVGAAVYLRPEPAPAAVKLVHVPSPPAPATLVDSLARGETLAEVLGRYGFSGLQIVQLVERIREFESPRRLRPGTVFHLAMRPAEPPERLALRLDADRVLHLVSGEGEGSAWEARLDSVPITVDTVRVGGRVATNLYGAELVGDVERLNPGESHDLVYHLSRIFAWQVDFWRDIRSGDTYRLAVEREVRPDGSVRSMRILGAEYVNAGRSLVAIPLEVDGRREYFDPDGEALRSQFLRAPLDFVRITSRFNLRRYHPILKRRRAHLGTDYGARPGTPVRATGAGVVSRAGWWGGYGRVVEIRHANNLRTRYAHLSGIARGVRAGSRVQQGQTVGYVGATGLATAPHLHYEFLRNGRQVNPARLDLPRAEPVPEERRAEFELVRAGSLALLDAVDPGGDAALADAAAAAERADE